MPQKVYTMILKTGIFFSFLSVFLVFDNLLFPYITSKQIYFNILIEILAIFWLAYLIKYPEQRPKMSWVSVGIICFLGALAISSVFGVDFNLSFWGDVERMLGVFSVLHYFVFYFIVITVMREWEDWRNLLIASVAAASALCLYILSKNVAYGTIGNTSYVSGYAIFNIFFALILLFRFRKSIKEKEIRWAVGTVLIIAVILMLYIFKFTHTRGAYVGLGAGFASMLLLAVFLSKNKKIKVYTLSLLAVFAAFIFLVFSFPNSPTVQKNSILNTMTQISLDTATFQTRLISWKTAWKDFPNHPIIGTGHGNFAISFDKYFDPSFYNHTRSETYFDRAHNNLVDIASTSGLLGLITYLFVIIATLYYLVKIYLDKKIDMDEFILLIGLIIAYLVQNLVMFDSQVTYLSLMIMLGFVYWLSRENSFVSDAIESVKGKFRRPGMDNKELFSLVIIGAIMIAIINQYNLRPLKMLTGTIESQIAFAKGDVLGGYEIYKKAESYNTVLDRDSRDSFIRLVSRPNALANIDPAKAREIMDYAISLARKNLEYNPDDSLMQTILSQVMNAAMTYSANNQNDYNYYATGSLEAIDHAIKASPGRIPLYFQKAQIYMGIGNQEKAIETLKYAESLSEKYYESTCQLARVYLYYKMEEEGYTSMDKCIDNGGVGELYPIGFVSSLVNHYVDKKDDTRILKLYERISQLDSGNSKVWVNLASLYEKAGEIDKAIEAAKKAGELDPGMKDAADEYIKQLESKK